jgi:hypothetical protein
MDNLTIGVTISMLKRLIRIKPILVSPKAKDHIKISYIQVLRVMSDPK